MYELQLQYQTSTGNLVDMLQVTLTVSFQAKCSLIV